MSLINDTVGTLLASSMENHDCSVGVVLATGFNVAYMEKVENIPKLYGFANIFFDTQIFYFYGNKNFLINT